MTDSRYKIQNEERKQRRAKQRERRRAEDARQALLVYNLTGNMSETGRIINASQNTVTRRIKKARELLKSGDIVLSCEIRL